MKQFLRSVSFVLALTMCLILPVSASEEVIPRASNYFGSTCGYLWKVNGTEFEVWFEVTAVDTMSELGTSVIKVQRSSDNENWTTMSTYKKEVYPQMIGRNTGDHSDCVTYYGASSGYYYRAFITFYAKNSSGTGEYYYYTASIQM